VPAAYLYHIRGWYKTFWSAGMSCDFVEASQLDDAKTQSYKTLVAPLQLSMSDKVAAGLLKYAENGGNLILEGGCGRLNEAAYAVRGQMNRLVREALQVKVSRFKLVREPDGDDRWSLPERSWGEFDEAGFLEGQGVFENLRLRANIYIETYEAAASDVCMQWNGKPAGIRKGYGKGNIWLIGTAMGPGATAHADDESKETFRQLLSLCGLRAAHGGRLLVQKRKAKDGSREAWIITNPLNVPVTETFDIPNGAQVCDLLGAGATAADGAMTLTVSPLDVRVVVVTG